MLQEPTGKASRRLFCMAAVAALFLTSCARTSPSSAPPNAPAKVVLKAGQIHIIYDGREIFTGAIRAGSEDLEAGVNVYKTGNKLSQVVLITSRGGTKAALSGTVAGGPEAFSCEADRRDRGLTIVRHSSGLSRSLLNRAIYDRGRDWVLSVDAGPMARILPIKEEPQSRTFGLEAEGAEIVLRFRPRFYQVHRGLSFFEPWTYHVWSRPVAGWVSWFAFSDRVAEQDIVETADTLAAVLLPFGYEYLQIDDGYQRGEGLPELWLTANAKFPRGLDFLPRYIKSKGLKPGLWTNVAFKQADFAAAHKDWFVRNGRGEPARGNWIEFSLDASNSQALEAVVKPIYKGLRGMGWEYYKLDALRHLRYEGYNAHADYFRGKTPGLVATFRRYVEAIRGEIGRDVFLLGCWGIRPELIGLIDGCRIGTDGFSYAGLAQYNSWNNVVWRNDPDHIELNDDRYRSTLVTSLTGSVLLLTDKPSLYRTADTRPARRAAPVLATLPGQLFDVDPSRSNALGRVDAEVSGSGPRVFDAGLTPTCDLFLLEIDRPFESWVVLGRTGESAREVSFADLGLDPAKEYFVYEFWSDRLLGSFTGRFAPGPLDPVFRSQALVIRERRPHPQVLCTSRHLTGGGSDLLDVRWNGGVLSGRSLVVPNDPYELVITEPPGFRLNRFEAEGTTPPTLTREGALLRVRVEAHAGGSREVSWTASFRQE